MADGLPVILRELTGQRREVVFEASAVPAGGFDVGGTLRTVRTHYPGTRVASTQVMGTEEDDIELRGVLRDSWTGVDGGAEATVAALRAIFLARRYCELAWGESLVRRGYLKRLVATPHRDGVWDFRIVFEVAESDEAEFVSTASSRKATLPKASDLRSALALVDAAAAWLDEVVAGVDVIQAVL